MRKITSRTWAAACVAFGLTFSAAGATAGGHHGGGCAPCVSDCGPSCNDCEQVFTQAGDDLAQELCRLTAECCATEVGCCDDDSCDGGCGDGCGLGGGGLFSGLFGGCGDTGCDDLGCDADACDGCGDDGCGWDIGGWIQTGYHNRSTGLFNDRPDRLNVHQTWIYAEKVADGSNGIGFGGRVDFMYGIDAGDTQAFGNVPGNWDYENGWDRGATYGFAMPQLYAEMAVGEDLSIIAGHFYTLLGYEVVTAPDNFFYSHAFTMYNSEAFTHTGVLATYAASDALTLYAGYTLGWDTGFDQYDLDGQNGSSFLGGFSYAVSDNTTATFITTFGDFGAIGDGYSHSVVIDTALTDKLNYVFQSDVLNAEGIEEDAMTGAVIRNLDVETVGINQYLLYAVSDNLGVGGRFEWWKADSDSIYQATAGLNVRPMDNLVVRPEVRWQWEPGTNRGIVESEGETIFGIDAIMTF